jgi:hypothetical protein
MLRSTPHGEDPVGDAGVSRVGFFAPGSPPGEDGIDNLAGHRDLYRRALATATPPGAPAQARPPGTSSRGEVDYLHLITIAEQQANLYVQQVNRRAWSRSYRAFHNEHFVGSKYGHRDWAQRSKIFRPKTRSAVRKDGAAVAASLFGTVDAIACSPGDEADPAQRAAAALMQELINYRTDRTSGRNAIPWSPWARARTRRSPASACRSSIGGWNCANLTMNPFRPRCQMSEVRCQKKGI